MTEIYVRCNACPDRWNCDFSKCCWNQVRQKQLEINSKLSVIDKIFAQRKEVDTVPPCPHTVRSTVGICMKCGDWL